MTDYKQVRLRSMGETGYIAHDGAHGRALKSPPALQPGRGQDRLAAQTRRVLLHGGLRGGDHWMVSTNQDASSLRNPDDSTPYSAAGPLAFTLNAGCALIMRALYWPAGYTQKYDGGYELDGKRGALQADVTWGSGASPVEEVTSHVIEMETSSDPYGAPPTGVGGWPQIREQWIVLKPPGWLTSKAQTRLYGAPGTLATVEVSKIGSPRIIYWCVHEVPHEVVAQLSDDQGAWGGMTDGAGKPLAAYPALYPITRLSETGDPYGGTFAALEAVEQNYLAARGGGVHWRAGGEHVDAIGDVVSLGPSGTGADEHPPLEVTSSTFVNILKSSDTEWSATSPGLGLSQLSLCAGTDAMEHSGTRAVMCKVSVRYKVSANTATLRVQTAPHSFVELTLDSTSEEVMTAAYRLDVGASPWDHVTAQALARQNTSGTLSLYEMEIVPLPPG